MLAWHKFFDCENSLYVFLFDVVDLKATLNLLMHVVKRFTLYIFSMPSQDLCIIYIYICLYVLYIKFLKNNYMPHSLHLHS